MNWARLQLPGKAGPRRAAPVRAPAATANRGPLDNVLDMQAVAGNGAVASIIGGPNVQRDTAGWTDADKSGKGWNVKAQDVDKVRRVPIEGLKLGTDTKFVGDEKEKTIESAAHRAIVIVPSALTVGAQVDVMLHLHGWTHRKDDPHAGWRQHSGPDATVRDVDQDRIEAQVQASGAQLVAILPQGVGESQFGDIPIEPYIEEVLGKVTAAGEFKDASRAVITTAPKLGRLVLSGHSGGGNRIMSSLAPGTAKEPAEVILFEALHYVEKPDKKDPTKTTVFDAPKIVGDWAKRHLDKVRKALMAEPPPDPAARAKAVNECPVLRAYYSDYSEGKFEPKRERKGYESNYERLAKMIDKWFADFGADLGSDLPAIRARFKVQPLTGTVHETVVRGLGDDPLNGPLTDALTALDKPEAASKLLTSGTTTWTKPRRLDELPKPPKQTAPKATPKTTPKTTKKGASIGPSPASGTGAAMAASTANTAFGAAEIAAALDRAGVGNPTISALLPTLLSTAEPLEAAATAFAMGGLRDDLDLTDALFDLVHRDLGGARIPDDRADLKAEWQTIHETYALPAAKTA